jgi:8-hydroxy-5-deazaflavin:NADPH oxidoreductase
MSFEIRTIAVIGGAGKQGYVLALRWAVAGHEIIIGSRDTSRAQEAAVTGAANTDGSADDLIRPREQDLFR